MIKKIVCAALMLSILAMSSMGAFAAVTSTTNYDGSASTITVTATVSDVEEGDTITYLAYDAGTEGTTAPADGNIAYIDQIEVAAGENYNATDKIYTFSYVTDAKYVGAKVLQAGLKKDGSTPITLDDATIENSTQFCNITVTCGEETVGTAKVVQATAATEGMYEIECSVVPATVTIADVEDLFWYTTANGFMIPKNLCTGSTLAITVTEMQSSATNITTSKVGNDAEGKMVIANVTGDVTGYGVIIAPEATTDADMVVDAIGIVDASDAESDASKETINKFPALVGLGENGAFMIKVNGLGTTAGEEYRVRAYATTESGVIYGDIVTLVIK